MTGKLNPGRVLLLLLMGVLLMTGACNEDDLGSSPEVPPEEPPVGPRTPETLLAGLVTTYENMDLQGYLDLLDEDFLFLLQPGTTFRIPDLGGALDFAEEERIHQRLFAGEAVVDPDGENRPAVLAVEFLQFQALDTWYNTDDTVRFPGTIRAIFSVDLVIDCGPEHTTYSARGQVKIYVRPYRQLVNGKEVTTYKLAGMVDLTQSDKGVERTPWGLIKAFYR